MDQGILMSLGGGLILGVVACWIVLRSRNKAAVNEIESALRVELAKVGERLANAQQGLAELESVRSGLEGEVRNLRQELHSRSEEYSTATAELRERLGGAQSTASSQAENAQKLQEDLENASRRNEDVALQFSNAKAQIAELNALLDAEKSQVAERIQWVSEQKEELANRFKALAAEILEEKAKRFTEQNQSNLDTLLGPLKSKLQEFQGKVEEIYVQEGKDRTALGEQVKNLLALNQQLSQDAHNLTSALKGQSKAQGDWGEVILERVLEESGLLKDLHYQVQVSLKQEDGRSQRPDVVIRLPEGRSLIVDSKVSLTAYQEYASADARAAQEQALKAHLASIRAHIKGLSEKNYQQLYDLTTLDFVLMFVPVEPAFMLAISQDAELWRDAWQRNVILVSPSTTLFVLRTVAHLWRQDQQSRNTQEIARRGAELYDKLVGFVKDLQQVGDRLQLARTSYDEAMSKLSEGRGNVIRQAEMLRDLGVKPTKSLPQDMVRIAAESDGQESLFHPDKAA